MTIKQTATADSRKHEKTISENTNVTNLIERNTAAGGGKHLARPIPSLAKLMAGTIACLALGTSVPAMALTAQTITGFTPTTPINYSSGKSFTLSAKGGASGNAVVYASTTTSICTVSGSKVSVLSVGTCKLTANQAGNSTYSAAPQVTANVVINKGSQTITFAALSGKSYGAAPFTVSATSSAGLTVAFTSTTTSVCTISGTTVTLAGLGTCTIDANQAGNANFNAATQVAQSFTVAKESQTITFAALSGKSYGAAPFTVGATSSAGLAVAFSSATTSVCTVSGSTVTLVGLGTCTIDANQAGNTNVSAATQVAQSFTVAKESQTITFAALSGKSYGAAPFAVSATSSAGLAVAFTSATTSVCTVSGSTVTLVAPGTCTIDANQAGNTDVNAATQVAQSFTVAKESQTISFGALSGQPLGAPPFTVSATSSAGLTVAFTSATTSVCTVSGSTVTLAASGTCTIDANQAGNGNVSAAPQVAQSFTVVRQSQTISFGTLGNVPYNTDAFAVSATSSSGLAVTFTSATPSVCTLNKSYVGIQATGTCTVTASQAGNATYAAATPVSQSFTVTPGTQSILFPALSNQTFGAQPFYLSAAASSDLVVTFASTTSSVCTVSGSTTTGYTVTLVSGGTCSIVASQSGDSNFGPAQPVTQSFTVLPASQSITFAAPSAQVLGQAPIALNASSSSGLPVGFASSTTAICIVNGNNVTLVAAGTCTIVASQAGNATYTAANAVTQSFTISTDSPPTVVLTSPTATLLLGTPASLNLSATAKSSDASIGQVQFLNGGTVIATVPQAPYSFNWTNIPIGTYSITARATDNYGVSSTSAPIAVTVEANPITVSLTSPQGGQSIAAPGKVSLTAGASDSNGTIAQMAFFNGPSLIGTKTQAPYSLSFPDLEPGTYTFTAQATDNQGVTATSGVVTVTVTPEGSAGGGGTGGAEQVYYIQTDQINTPRQVVDASSNVVWQWDNIDPFGNNLPNQDPNGSGTRFIFNLRFTGQYSDVETGTYYNFYRDYDPSIGRYIQSDLVGLGGGSLSTYAYTGNNPIARFDPDGLQAYNPPNEKKNTVTCDGEGGMQVQISPDAYTGCGIGDCMRQHEEQHIKDLSGYGSLVCQGKKAGTIVTFTTDCALAQSEVRAVQIELDCLNALLEKHCPNCDANLQARIKQMQEYLAKKQALSTASCLAGGTR